MKYLQIFLFSCLCFLLISCGNEQATTTQTTTPTPNTSHALQDSLWKSVMATHDEIMPKMGEINRQKRALKKHKETAPTQKEAIEAAILALSNAEESMMSWMNQIKQLEKLRETKSHPEIMEYLAGENAKVQKMKADFTNSMEQGSKLLSTLQETN